MGVEVTGAAERWHDRTGGNIIRANGAYETGDDLNKNIAEIIETALYDSTNSSFTNYYPHLKKYIMGKTGNNIEMPSYNINNKLIHNNSEEPKSMDNNDLILKLIEKVEQSNQQLKNDIVDAERRIFEEKKESEKRITEERRLSEERMEKRFIETMESVKELSNKIDSSNKELSNKIDVNNKDLNDKIERNNRYINNISISVIIGIGAIAVALIVAIFTFIYSNKQPSNINKTTTLNDNAITSEML